MSFIKKIKNIKKLKNMNRKEKRVFMTRVMALALLFMMGATFLYNV